MTVVIFILFFVGTVLILWNSKKGMLFLLLGLASYLIVGCGLLPYLFLNNLQSPYHWLDNPDWGKRNVIILLGAGNIKLPDNTVKPSFFAFSRTHEAAVLFTKCQHARRICKILLSGGDPLHTGQSEAEINRSELVKIGIPQKDIILEPNSQNTYKNAENTSLILRNYDFDRVFLITSGIHMKRSLLYYTNFKIYPFPAISDYLEAKLSFLPIAYNFVVTDIGLHEYIGIIRFYLYNRLGWNKIQTS